jgi:hypothetical protein
MYFAAHTQIGLRRCMTLVLNLSKTVYNTSQLHDFAALYHKEKQEEAGQRTMQTFCIYCHKRTYGTTN